MTFVAIPDKSAGDAVTLAMYEAVQDALNAGVRRPLAHTVLASPASSIVFSSIPATHADLFVVLDAYHATAYTATYIRLNGDTGANYHVQYLEADTGGTWTATQSASQTAVFIGRCQVGNTGSARAAMFINIPNYLSTTQDKMILWHGNLGSSGEGKQGSGVWDTTPAAVTSITLYPSSGNFDTYTMATLYGIGAI